ncbi:hypothetical protein, partial [uncultured Shewanella sp.]|uniref:hypothetical protein n=1 Tax=uncultured Shewanella sp. TaxID=173975 RepID=UPI002621193B
AYYGCLEYFTSKPLMWLLYIRGHLRSDIGAGSALLAIGYWLLAIGYWLLFLLVFALGYYFYN